MTIPGEGQSEALTPEQQEFTVPTFAMEVPAGDNSPWQLAELYMPRGVMRVVTLVGDEDPYSSVIDLRDVALMPHHKAYQEKRFQERMNLGRQLLAEAGVDLSQIPAGYPEIETLVAQARMRPSVSLLDLVPGQHYLYVYSIVSSSPDPELRTRSFTVFQFEEAVLANSGLNQIFKVYRRHDPQLDKHGHVLLKADYGWEPRTPLNLTFDRTEAGWRLMTKIWKQPGMDENNQFHELTGDDVALVAALRATITMNRHILP